MKGGSVLAHVTEMTKLTKESAPNDEQKRAKWSLTIPFYFSAAHHFISDLQLCMLRGTLHHPAVALRHSTVALRMFRPISIGLPHPHRRRHPCPGALCAQNTVLPQLLP